MKALELLRDLKKSKNIPLKYDAIEKAIEELENISSLSSTTSCDGCFYNDCVADYPDMCWDCSRNYFDMYESKPIYKG